MAPYRNSMMIKRKCGGKRFQRRKSKKNTLNFGHATRTCCREVFLEKADKIIPHGEAVALGMIAETHLANLENLITEETATEIIKISEDSIHTFQLKNLKMKKSLI